jgi:glycosyltransferase involved in cell wall biosynthesis
MVKKRIFYFGMVSTPGYCIERNLNLYVGAGAVKMMGIVKSLRAVGAHAHLVTLPVLHSAVTSRYQRSGFISKDGFPAIFLPSFRSVWLRKICGFVGFLTFAIRKIRRCDHVVVYNHSIEYVPALVALLFKGVEVLHDIEDLPLQNEKGVRGFFNRLGYGITVKLTSPRKIVVSRQIAERLKLKCYLPVYGACTAIDFAKSKWDFSTETTFRVHYGGTLANSTGLDLFAAAVLRLLEFDKNIKISFQVTGQGGSQTLDELAMSLRESNISLEIFDSLPRERYLEVLCSCHTSLSLKLASDNISSTTFPSKVLEIVSHGVALVSTCVSDVPLLFDETNAFLLSEETPDALASLLYYMSRAPAEVQNRAAAGHLFAIENFSQPAVGNAVRAFISGPPASEL